MPRLLIEGWDLCAPFTPSNGSNASPIIRSDRGCCRTKEAAVSGNVCAIYRCCSGYLPGNETVVAGSLTTRLSHGRPVAVRHDGIDITPARRRTFVSYPWRNPGARGTAEVLGDSASYYQRSIMGLCDDASSDAAAPTS